MNNSELYTELSLLGTTRKIHNEDLNPIGLNVLNQVIAEKPLVKYKGKKTPEYGFLSFQLGDCVRIKLAHSLLGKLYEENPWESTPEFHCPVSLIEFVKYEEEFPEDAE